MVKQAKDVQAEMAKHETPRFEMRHRMQLALEYSGTSTTEIADEIGVSRTTISNWIHGRTEPQRSHLVVWALRCGVPFEWLVQGDDPTGIEDQG